MASDKLTETINDIIAQRQFVKTNQKNPSVLSEALVKMATTNADLGDWLSWSRSEYEADRGARYLELIKEGKSNTQAENTVRTELHKQISTIKRLELLHMDTARLISALQSRLRGLESEAKGSY